MSLTLQSAKLTSSFLGGPFLPLPSESELDWLRSAAPAGLAPTAMLYVSTFDICSSILLSLVRSRSSFSFRTGSGGPPPASIGRAVGVYDDATLARKTVFLTTDGSEFESVPLRLEMDSCCDACGKFAVANGRRSLILRSSPSTCQSDLCSRCREHPLEFDLTYMEWKLSGLILEAFVAAFAVGVLLTVGAELLLLCWKRDWPGWPKMDWLEASDRDWLILPSDRDHVADEEPEDLVPVRVHVEMVLLASLKTVEPLLVLSTLGGGAHWSREDGAVEQYSTYCSMDGAAPFC